MRLFLFLSYRTFLLCFIIVPLLLSCSPMMRFERYRTYFPNSIDGLYRLSSDIENVVFDKYTINGTKFILLAEPYWYNANLEEIRKNITGCRFLFKIFTKAEYTVTYRLMKATIETSSFTIDIDKNDMKINEVVFVSSEVTTRSDGYKVETMLSNLYRFPCPRDMKYSITVLIEEEKEDGTKSMYEFKYFFFLKKKDNWIRLIS